MEDFLDGIQIGDMEKEQTFQAQHLVGAQAWRAELG